MNENIQYGNIYQDDDYEYRNVVIKVPEHMLWIRILKETEKYEDGLLPEDVIRKFGIQMSNNWEHYATNEKYRTLYFKREKDYINKYGNINRPTTIIPKLKPINNDETIIRDVPRRNFEDISNDDIDDAVKIASRILKTMDETKIHYKILPRTNIVDIRVNGKWGLEIPEQKDEDKINTVWGIEDICIDGRLDFVNERVYKRNIAYLSDDADNAIYYVIDEDMIGGHRALRVNDDWVVYGYILKPYDTVETFCAVNIKSFGVVFGDTTDIIMATSEDDFFLFEADIGFIEIMV